METVLDASISYIIEDHLQAYRQLVLENCSAPLFFPQKTIISEYGKPVKCLYFLLGGTVKIYTNNQNGFVRIVGYHKKNTVFAMDHLERHSLAVVTSESVTPVTVIPVYDADLLRLNALNNTFMLDMLRYYCTILRLMCFDAENQSSGNATTRLANYLTLYMQTKEYQSKGFVDMSQCELASAVNISQVHLARILATMRQHGIVDTEYRKIHIKNWDKLNKMATANQHM